MISKLFNILVLTLAINFLLVLGGALWLKQAAQLDNTKVAAIKEILFPPPTTLPTTQPTDPATTTQPTLKLEAILAKYAGKRAGEQAQGIQTTFDAQAALLERQRRELEDLQSQLNREKERLAQEAMALETGKTALAEQERKSQAVQEDKGFEDSLKLYTGMQPKQVKAIFLSLPDESVVKYLTAMPPRTAAKITKEYKTPDELTRLNRIMERMGSGKPTTRPALAGDAGTPAEPK
jgi:flagellar motility protein MotE (MotC chaperone)